MGGGVQPAAQRTLRRFRQALRRQGGLRRERARRVRGATRPRRDAPPAVRGHGAVHPQRGLTDGDGGCAAVGERAAGQPRVGSGHAHRRRLGRRVRRCERRARRAARDGGLRRRHRVHARRRACARQGAPPPYPPLNKDTKTTHNPPTFTFLCLISSPWYYKPCAHQGARVMCPVLEE
ncbi:hypothetical protein T492DRAFT_1071151 [Pavlovales sp. CCMP2436]|nr:hypothetical protein T492DRAFT_1071151 [Pavlovales sp. CCMP2436]